MGGTSGSRVRPWGLPAPIAEWPYRLLGLGYGVLAAGIFVVGSVRQRRGAKALRQGDLVPPLSPLVMWVTFAAIALTIATLALLAIGT